MAVSTGKEIRNKVIYQIFTRNYKDGTFKAVEDDIERIKALGVDYIYLLPVQPSGEVHRKGTMGSPYAIKDYRAVDPVQGTMEDFIQLTETIHAAGMKVMLDVVYNHTSPDSWLAQNHPEWFYHKEDGNFGNRIGEWWDVIDLDYSNKELWDYQIDTLKMWAEYVDGFRCDVAPFLPLEFWKKARKEVETVRPGCLWLAESVEPEFILACRRNGIPVLSDSEMYQVFDICYDYDIYGYMKGAMQGKNSLGKYLDFVNLQEAVYPENFSKLRCLENHDRPRAATLAPEPQVLRNWTAWIYFMTGTTMIYAGQEFCATRHPSLFDHDEVPFETDNDLSSFMSKLAEIKKNPVFACGGFHAEAAGINQEVILAVQKMQDNDKTPGRYLVGIFSTSGRKQALAVDLPDGTYVNMINGEKIDVFEKTIAYDGEPVIISSLSWNPGTVDN